MRDICKIIKGSKLVYILFVLVMILIKFVLQYLHTTVIIPLKYPIKPVVIKIYCNFN